MNDSLLEIPGYLVHGRLGKGGMAEVYLATQESLHRQVAIKVLLSADDEAFSKRFIKEGHIVASLHHPSIITIYDIDQLPDGRYYLAMEFVAGGDLAQHKGEVFEAQRAFTIVRQIASGLAVVHDKGMVHRDIKPANILFRADGTAVITDFGIAKELDLNSELTQFNVAVGSPAYSSPEQAQCEPLDARSDIYSLGVILLEMLTGANPYKGSSYTQTVMNHVQMEAPELPDHLRQFQPFLSRMLAKDPDERFADCHVLLASLAELNEQDLDHTRIAPVVAIKGKGKTTSRGEVSEAPFNVPTSKVAVKVPKVRKGKSKLWPALLGLVLVAGIAGVGGYYYQQKQKVAEFLTQGELSLNEGKLVEPPEHNADYFYRQALLIDKNNAAALDGLQRVLQARIANSLNLAQQAASADRLILPEGDNAVFYYQQVLGWSPGNDQALTGLQAVAERFFDLSEAAYDKLQFEQALQLVKSGLEAQPDNEKLLKSLDGHDERVRKTQEAIAARAAAAKKKAAAAAAAKVTPSRAAPASNSAAAAPAAEENNPNVVKRLWNKLFN
ncbi:MAG: protein kinase [Pseudomonas sp.]|uniref:serine/threonine protein kinase n=1 Tax=Pseudomonas sp. TaxID=306 RepID=UPI0030F3592C